MKHPTLVFVYALACTQTLILAHRHTQERRDTNEADATANARSQGDQKDWHDQRASLRGPNPLRVALLDFRRVKPAEAVSTSVLEPHDLCPVRGR